MRDGIAFDAGLAWLAAACIGIAFPHWRAGRWSVPFSLAAFACFCYYFRDYTVDDAYISLRYARNLHEGLGLTFSAGDRPPVEGYTNFLWVAGESLLFLPAWGAERILLGVKAAGCFLGCLSLLAARSLASRAFGGRAGMIAAFLFAALPGMAFWAVGGLETQLFLACMLGGMAAHFREHETGKPHLLSAGGFLLAALTRPEGLCFTAGFWAWQIAAACRRALGDGAGWRALRENLHAAFKPYAAGLAVFLPAYGIYSAWRLGYYGFLFPNSFYAKTATYGAVDMLHRLAGIAPLGLGLLPMAVAAAWALVRNRGFRERAFQAGLPIAFLLLAVLSLAAKTEWMPGHRYELPAAALLLVLGAGALDAVMARCFRHPAARLSLPAVAAAMTLWAAPGLHENVNYASRLRVAHAALGKWIGACAPRPVSLAAFDLGALAFFSGAERVIEANPLGLLSIETAHSGYDPERIVGERPDLIVLQHASGNAMERVYALAAFRSDYRPLFAFHFSAGLILDVFARKGVRLAPEAVAEGERLARFSRETL